MGIRESDHANFPINTEMRRFFTYKQLNIPTYSVKAYEVKITITTKAQ
jgi:hypothetical protein